MSRRSLSVAGYLKLYPNLNKRLFFQKGQGSELAKITAAGFSPCATGWSDHPFPHDFIHWTLQSESSRFCLCLMDKRSSLWKYVKDTEEAKTELKAALSAPKFVELKTRGYYG